MKTALFAVLGALAVGLPAAAGASQGPSQKRALSVADVIESTRLSSASVDIIFSSSGVKKVSQDVLVSPDGARYVAMLIRGDIARNGNWAELISGRLDSLESASRIDRVARLFTTSLSSPDRSTQEQLTMPGINPLVWLDNEQVALLWNSGEAGSKTQAIVVNVRTHAVRNLTHHATDLVSFAVSPAGTVVYAAKARHLSTQSAELLHAGFSVGNMDIFSVLRGELDGYSALDRMYNAERFILSAPDAVPIEVDVNGEGHDRVPPILAKFAANNRYAVVDGSPAKVPAQWSAYRHISVQRSIADAQRNSLESLGGRLLRQLFVLDLQRGTSRPLWNAPGIPYLKVEWSPTSRSVLVAPTFLPSGTADEAGLTGQAVAEVDIATGRYSKIPISAEQVSRGIFGLRWLADTLIEVDAGDKRYHFHRRGGQWKAGGEAGTIAHGKPAQGIKIELRQQLNSPPALFAVDSDTGKEALILDLNPRLRTELALGKVEHASWNDDAGRTWGGLLYYPVNYEPGRRFPLVIQTHGHASVDEFSLTGKSPGLGPGYSVFAAQPLANRDITVLHMEDKHLSGIINSPREPQMYAAAYEAAVRHLVSVGIVDPEKVGLVGFSRSGWHVQYALTHSKFPYAAAISSDNADASYVQSVLSPGAYVDENGAAPFGEGLKMWLESAPGFNADNVRAPLRLQVESGGLPAVLSQWEMFSRLRQLNKPVELYVVPRVDRGDHNLQNPAQCLAAQQGAVDWFDFWLNGHEDTDSGKAKQYQSWRALRAKQPL